MRPEDTLHFVTSRYGTMGPRSVLMIGAKYIGYLYPDASDGVDVDGTQDEIARRFNTHDQIMEALKAAEKMHDFLNDRLSAVDEKDRRIADENIRRLYGVIDKARIAVANYPA